MSSINISLNEYYQKRFRDLTDKKHLSMAEQLRRWIDESWKELEYSNGCPEDYMSCKFYDTTQDNEFHCVKDSNVGICLKEKSVL